MPNNGEAHVPLQGSIIPLLFDSAASKFYIKAWLEERLPLALPESQEFILRNAAPPVPREPPCRLGSGREWVASQDPAALPSLSEQVSSALRLVLESPAPLQLHWIVLGIWFSDKGARMSVEHRSPAEAARRYFDAFESRLTAAIMGTGPHACVPAMVAVAKEQIIAKSAYEASGFIV